MNCTNQIAKHRINRVHLGGWLIIVNIEQIEFGKKIQMAVRGELHAEKPRHAQIKACNTSYPVLFTGETAAIVLDWARARQEQPVKMMVDGRLLRKGPDLVVLARYVEVQEVITGPLATHEEVTRPTPGRNKPQR